MGENQHLRIKIGDFEFEADGPTEAVEKQLDAFKQLVTGAPARPTPPPAPEETGNGNEHPDGNGEPAEGLPMDALERHFTVDRRRRLVTLQVHPAQGTQREANAILLVLYGFLRYFNEDNVLVGRLKDALEQSGIQPKRIDKAIAPHQRAGMVLKGGRAGPGGRYRLSNTGIREAERLIRELT